jgi:hypothetical protein
MEGDVKVAELLSGGSLAATMAMAGREGNPPQLLFQGFIENCGVRVAWNVTGEPHGTRPVELRAKLSSSAAG